MKRLALILTPILLLAGAVTAFLTACATRQEWTEEELARYVEDLKAAVEKRDFEAVRPIVRVTHRSIPDLRHAVAPEWASAMWQAMTRIRSHKAVGLRDRFIQAIVEDAQATGEESLGLKRFLTGPFLAWRPLKRSNHPLAALPCFADLVIFQGRPAWVIVVAWEVVAHQYSLTAHIAYFAIDPGTGEILAQGRCG